MHYVLQKPKQLLSSQLTEYLRYTKKMNYGKMEWGERI